MNTILLGLGALLAVSLIFGFGYIVGACIGRYGDGRDDERVD